MDIAVARQHNAAWFAFESIGVIATAETVQAMMCRTV